MAYYSQEMKKAVQPEMKKLLKEYGLKGSLSVRDYRSVVLTIKSGAIDFNKSSNADDYNRQVNVYWIENNWTGKAKEFLLKAKKLLNTGNYDNSDIMTDYFDIGWYVDINLGKWDQPYAYEPAKTAKGSKPKAKKKSTKEWTNLEGEATKKQLWALFCITKKDHRNMSLSRQEAYNMLQELTA